MRRSADSKENFLENKLSNNLLEKINTDANDVEEALEKTLNEERTIIY